MNLKLNNGIYILKNIMVVPLLLGWLLLLTACPSETFCDLDVSVLNKPDQIIFSPAERGFSKNDVINVTISIPSKGNGNGNSYDIYKSLTIENSEKFTNISELLDGNEYTVNKGKLENSQIILSYSHTEDSYEFDCDIVLKRADSYKIFGKSKTISFVKDLDNCEYFPLRTTIKGINQNGFYEFTVE